MDPPEDYVNTHRYLTGLRKQPDENKIGKLLAVPAPLMRS